MPNWVTNDLLIMGSKEEVEAFKKAHIRPDRVDGHAFDFMTVIPVPKKVQDPWEVAAYWGTKWNSSSFDWRNKGAWIHGLYSIEFVFNTAWSHPEAILLKISELYPDLKFYFTCIEESWDYALVGEYMVGLDYTVEVPITPDLYEQVYGHGMDKEEKKHYPTYYRNYLKRIKKAPHVDEGTSAWEWIGGLGVAAGILGVFVYFRSIRQQAAH